MSNWTEDAWQSFVLFSILALIGLFCLGRFVYERTYEKRWNWWLLLLVITAVSPYPLVKLIVYLIHNHK